VYILDAFFGAGRLVGNSTGAQQLRTETE